MTKVSDVQLEVNSAGCVANFPALLQSEHKAVQQAWQLQWQSMKADPQWGLTASWDAPHLPLRDIMLFVLQVNKARKKQEKRPWKDRSRAIVTNLLHAFVGFLTDVLHQSLSPSSSLNAPSRNVRRSADSDTQKVNLETVWNLCQEATRKGISLAKLAEVREDDAHGGVKPTSTGYWSKKILAMYQDRARTAFLACRHFNIVMDGASHGPETLVSYSYSTDIDGAVAMAVQQLSPGKLMMLSFSLCLFQFH